MIKIILQLDFTTKWFSTSRIWWVDLSAASDPMQEGVEMTGALIHLSSIALVFLKCRLTQDRVNMNPVGAKG